MMSRFPRMSHMVMAGAAGLGVLMLVPADPQGPTSVNGLAISEMPAAAGEAAAVELDPTSSPKPAAAVPQVRSTAATLPLATNADAVSTPKLVALAVPDAMPEPKPELPETSPVEPEATRPMWVGGSALNVRVGPSVDTAKLFVLQPGQKVAAAEESGGWTLVTTDSGESGWVASRYLSDERYSPPKRRQVAERSREEPRRQRRATPDIDFMPTNVPLELRAGPSRFAPRLATLAPGGRVAITERRGNWVRVVLEGGGSAWVEARRVR